LDDECCEEGNNKQKGNIIVGNNNTNTSETSKEETATNDTLSDIVNEEVKEVISSPKDLPFTIVTGASKNHFCPLKSFLYKTHETIEGFKKARIVVYDLGLSKSQRKILDLMRKKRYLTELKTFNWSVYPSFWNINIAKGEYAWKPGMVYEISKEYPGIIIWLDSGTKAKKRFFENLDGFLKDFNGFVTPQSSGHMKKWVHKGVYDYFNDDHKKYDDLPNCNGAAVAFDTKRSQSLIDAWYKCALVKNCIAPPGSSRRNHRQDQALLTYLAAREGRICEHDKPFFGLRTHDDKICKSEINRYEKSK